MFIRPTDSKRGARAGPILSRTFRRLRRPLAAALAGLAALIIMAQLSPPEPAMTTYVAAASPIPAGRTVAADDVEMVLWPTSVSAPNAYTSTEDVIGRVAAGPLAQGELVGQSRLVGPGLLEAANVRAPGDRLAVVAAPVRLADPGQVALVRPGDVVDVLAARAIDGGGQSATIVASDATVITVPGTGPDDGTSGLLGSGSTGDLNLDGGRLVLLAVDGATATELAAAATRSQLSVVLKPVPTS